MNLVTKTKVVAQWIYSIILTFMAVRPWTTFSMINAVAIKNFCTLLASFLPLKVILLAGSDGVPRYFSFFIPEGADKMPWIIGITITAVTFFILTLIMEALAQRLAKAGSFDVLRGANEMAVTSQQREEAGTYFSQFSEIAANGMILIVALTLLAIVNLAVFVSLTGLMIMEYLFTTTVLAFGNPYRPGRVLAMVQEKFWNYLNLLRSINFLICFLVLLTPFLTGEGGNLILAILALLLMNQASSAVADMAKSSYKLWRKKPKIDPLVFRDEHNHFVERPVTRELRQVFSPGIRSQNAQQRLESVGFRCQRLYSAWQDPPFRDAYCFHLHAETEHKSGKLVEQHFQQQVFPIRQLKLLEHEEFLFSHLSRQAVNAPEIFARYSDGPFECQICAYGNGQSIKSAKWKQIAPDLYEQLWRLQLPEDLVAAFRTSHPTLEARLMPELLQRVEIALETAKDNRLYRDFIAALPELQEQIGRVPLCLHNPDLKAPNIVLQDNDKALIMTWVRWSLAPMGANLPPSSDRRWLEAMAQTANRRQRGKRPRFRPSHLELVNQCSELELLIKKERFNAALRTMNEILESEPLNQLAGS